MFSIIRCSLYRHVLGVLHITQIYLQGAYGPRYQWIIPGWYNDNWMDVNDTVCTNSQIKEAAMFVISVVDIKGDLTGLRTISGMVRNLSQVY